MKRLLLMLFCGLLLSGVTNATESEVTRDNLVYTLNPDDHTAVVKGYVERPTGNLIIPSTVSEGGVAYTVTEIGSYVFEGCSGLTTISFPSSLQKIGSSAFSWCTRLATVNFPSSLQEIGNSTFDNCVDLTTVNFPSGLQKIGNSAFSCCSDLTTINFPSGLREIGEGVFDSCIKISSFSIGEANPYYTCRDGVLYNKDMTELYAYPCAKEGTIWTVPSTVKVIMGGLFGAVLV